MKSTDLVRSPFGALALAAALALGAVASAHTPLSIEKAKITIGNCGSVAGEQTWSHKSDGKPGGRRVCGIEWV